MKSTEEFAQWIIDIRYPKNEKEKVSDTELYNQIVEYVDAIKNFKIDIIGGYITKPLGIGMWYKYIGPSGNLFTTGKWYFCPDNNYEQGKAFINNTGMAGGFHPNNKNKFDISNPQFSNPDERTTT